MIDYIAEIAKAKSAYIKAWTTFSDKLNEWEEEHEHMGEFTIGLNYKDKKEVYIRFVDENINMDIVNKACEDFNLQIMNKYTDEQYYGIKKSKFTQFILRHKEHPYGTGDDYV